MPAPRLPGRSDLRLLVRHPKTVWRVAKGYARVLCGERRPLRGAEFCVTYRCQLNCAHCLTKPLIDGQRKEMSTTQAIEAMRGLGRAGAVFVNITGGEALLRRDLFDILHGVTDSGMLVTLASNGFLIDDSVARELKRCGVSIVTLSLDGPTAAVHDASRGRAGAFDALMRAVDHLKSEDIPIWFTTILTRKNAEDGSIFDTAELAKNLGATLTLNWTYAIGRHWSKKSALVSDVERDAWDRLLAMPHVRWEGSTNFRAEGCPAGSEKIYVTPYGDVFPCAIIQTGFGNLLDEPIEEIWKRMGAVASFDGRVKPCLVACDEEFINKHFEFIRRAPGQPHEPWAGACTGDTGPHEANPS